MKDNLPMTIDDPQAKPRIDFRAKAATAYALMDLIKPASTRATLLVGTCHAAIQRVTIAQWAKATAEAQAEAAARG